MGGKKGNGNGEENGKWEICRCSVARIAPEKKLL